MFCGILNTPFLYQTLFVCFRLFPKQIFNYIYNLSQKENNHIFLSFKFFKLSHKDTEREISALKNNKKYVDCFICIYTDLLDISFDKIGSIPNT